MIQISPTESTTPVSEIHVEFPRVISFVTRTRPAIEILRLDSDGDSVVGEPIVPSALEITGRIVTFRFSPSVSASGEYRVKLDKSAFEYKALTEGGSDEPVYASGSRNRYIDFTLSVVINVAVPEELEQIETRTPILVPTDDGAFDIEVYIDGRKRRSGTYGLGGEVITIAGSDAASATLTLEPLVGEARSLYSQTYTRRLERGSDGEPFVHYYAYSAIAYGRTMIYEADDRYPIIDGHLYLAEAVRTLPAVDLPGVTRSMVDSATLVLTRDLEEPLVFGSYTVETLPGRPILQASFPALDLASIPIAVLDLPINHRIAVIVDDVEVWWGYTKAVPMLVSVRQAAEATGTPVSAELYGAVLRASVEALMLWKCALPALPTATMREYVIARVTYGWPAGDAITGNVSVVIGDSRFSGTVSDDLRRRLRTLVAQLQACETRIDIFPEDRMFTAIAYPSGAVHPGAIPRPPEQLEERPYANLERSEFRRLPR